MADSVYRIAQPLFLPLLFLTGLARLICRTRSVKICGKERTPTHEPQCTPAHGRSASKYLVDVGLVLGRRLDKGAVVEDLGEALALVLADDALVLEVAFVAHEHHGDRVRVLDTENLVVQVLPANKRHPSIRPPPPPGPPSDSPPARCRPEGR